MYKFKQIELLVNKPMNAERYTQYNADIKLVQAVKSNNRWMCAVFTLCLCVMMYSGLVS